MPASSSDQPMPDASPVRLLVRVGGADEAVLAAKAGADGVEATPESARLVRAAYPGRLRLLCEYPPAEDVPGDADEISLPASALPAGPLRPGHLSRPAIVARLPLPQAAPDRIAALRGLADAVTIEVAATERLFAVSGIAALDGCARACRAAALPFGFAGNLEAPDVARLLLLAPDHLGFDRAARLGHRADAALDPHALDMLRGLIPRGDAAPAAPAGTLDRLFVRDLVLPLSIGAYRAERDARQRVRFSVEADVAREAASPRDMRDVVSYDIIVETIRMLAGRPHVAFVETLAEEIAATLLAQPRLVAVTVTVEKLDVVEGSVGIRIVRRKRP